MFTLLMTALDVYEKSKEESGFIIKNISSMKEGEIITLQVEFEERMGSLKSSKYINKKVQSINLKKSKNIVCYLLHYTFLFILIT